MIARLLLGSARRRLGHLGLIALATAVAAGTVASATGLGERLADGLRGTLHAAGPNLLVRPQVGGPGRLPADELERLGGVPGVLAAAGVTVRPASARLVEAAGALRVELTAEGAGELDVLAASPELLALHPEWEVEDHAGRAFAAGRAVLLGARTGPARETGEPGAGAPVDPDALLRPAGRLTTGDALDRAVIVPRALLAGRIGVDRVEVRAEPARVEAVAAEIERRVAGAEARPLVKVTATDARVTRNLQALMAGVGGICLLLALVTVVSATLALLEERRKEMALFLSLGYTGRWVQGLLTAELSLVGLLSVTAGSLAGEAVAAGLARRVLGLAGSWAPSAPGLAAGAVAVLAVIAAAAALVRRRVERLDPALVLQGN
jgi:hypothetical protein